MSLLGPGARGVGLARRISERARRRANHSGVHQGPEHRSTMQADSVLCEIGRSGAS